jgi:hypothetical protein
MQSALNALQLGSCLNKTFAFLIIGILLEVFDEEGGQFNRFLFPFRWIGVGVTGIQDSCVNTRK